jgi:hypothetical protein
MIAAQRTSRATVTIDLAAIADNRPAHQRAAPAELWAVVKADGYGRGASLVGRAASPPVPPGCASRRGRGAGAARRPARRAGAGDESARPGERRT